MPRPSFTTVDEYLAAQPDNVRSALTTVRAILREELPGAEERISYQIPSFRWAGRNALFYAGYATHYAVYPVSAGIRRALGDALTPHLSGKATLRFRPDEPVPVDLLHRIGAARRAELAASPKQGRRKATPA